MLLWWRFGRSPEVAVAPSRGTAVEIVDGTGPVEPIFERFAAARKCQVRSRRCSRVYSSNSETPNSNNMTPQITSMEANMRAGLLAGTMSP